MKSQRTGPGGHNPATQLHIFERIGNFVHRWKGPDHELGSVTTLEAQVPLFGVIPVLGGSVAEGNEPFVGFTPDSIQDAVGGKWTPSSATPTRRGTQSKLSAEVTLHLGEKGGVRLGLEKFAIEQRAKNKGGQNRSIVYSTEPGTVRYARPRAHGQNQPEHRIKPVTAPLLSEAAPRQMSALFVDVDPPHGSLVVTVHGPDGERHESYEEAPEVIKLSPPEVPVEEIPMVERLAVTGLGAAMYFNRMLSAPQHAVNRLHA